MRQLACLFLLSLVLVWTHPAWTAPQFEKVIKSAKEKNLKGEWAKSIDSLLDLKDEGLSRLQLADKYFSLGKAYLELNDYPKSVECLTKALEFEKSKLAYVHYLLGHTYKLMGDFQKATDHFNKTIEMKPPRNIIYDARYEFSEMASKLGKPQKALVHLKYLERRWRGTSKHPEIVWRLVGVELSNNRRWQACRWARKMYSSYAGHKLVEDWGVDLPENKYEKNKLGCLASPKDLKTRIKRLQLYGQADRARQELDQLIERKSEGSKYDVDLMLAEFLEFQGFPDEALKVLIKHYEKQKNDFGYLNLLAKVASRAGEFPTAVGAYYRAYEKHPRSSQGRKALFSAAFLSYQFQDYDGASRKFQEINRRFPGSGLAKDSKWHMAWIRYLKRDYVGAEKDMKSLMSETYRHRRRRYQPFNNDRTRYWLGMSLLRQQKNSEALGLFGKISKDQSYSYYSILASERLRQIGTPMRDPALATEAENLLPNGEILSLPGQLGIETTATSEEEESEDSMSADSGEDVSKGSEDETSVESAEEAAEESKEDKVIVSSFRDPKLQESFNRANDFIRLGFLDWARWELYEIEKRTANKTYLKMLMDAYSNIGSYNRALYISEIYFSTDRNRWGFAKARDLWQWNFPQAYASDVKEYSKSFGIPAELTWSIMRAESNFYPDAVSPVGARGLMQIMQYTADQLARIMDDDDYHAEKLTDPKLNIKYGSRYLSRLQRKFEGQIPLVAAAYNAGPHRVYSWLNNFGNLEMDEFVEHIPFVETRNYVKKVVRHYVVYRGLYNSADTESLSWITSSIPVRVSEKPSPRENWGAID